MDKRSKPIIGAVLMVLLACSCGKSTVPPAYSELKHDTNDPVRSEGGWNWIQLSKDDFVKDVLAQVIDRDAPQPLSSAEALLEERAKYWVDRIDAKLREKYPEELANVPKPQTIVVDTTTPNAFISGAYTCFNAEADLGREGTKTPVAYIDFEHAGEISLFPTQQVRCLSTKSLAPLKAAILAFNTSQAKKDSQACQLTLSNGIVTFSQSCSIHEDLTGVGSSSKLAIPLTANWVTIHVGLYPAMPTEKAFIGVLAHELGHYYRSHVTSFASDYDFFYELGEHNPDRKPEANHSLDQFGKMAILASTIAGNELPKIDQQILPPEVYLLSGSIAEKNCSDGSCPASCKKITDWEHQLSFTDKMGLYPFMPPNDKDFYFAFEAAVLDCLEKTTAGFAGTSAEITQPALFELLAGPIWVPFEDFIGPEGKAYMSQFQKSLAARLNLSLIKNEGSSLSWIQNIAQDFHQQNLMASQILNRATTYGLGYYTTEQEADELSLEWLSLIGFDPHAGVDTYLALAGLGGDSPGSHVVSGKSCHQLYADQWLDASGQLISVPLGDYSEVHHSACFRAFNAWKEIRAHRYEIPSEEPYVMGPSWEEVQNIAKRVIKDKLSHVPASTDRASSPSDASAAVLRLEEKRHSHWKKCPFSPKSL